MRDSAFFSTDKLYILRDSLRDVKGLSLLEVLIAVIILAIALTSISYFFSRARVNIETSGHMRCGLVLAQDKMETLKDLGYSHPDLSGDLSGETHSDRVDSAGDPDADDRPFYREWTVYDIDDDVDGTGPDEVDYKRVELKIYDQRLSPAEALNHENKLVAELRTYISP
jgi:prepilin-type N-terminal cleavage/methylation domain-containing protein